MSKKRTYERRLKAKRDAQRAARRRAERMRKLRIGGSAVAAVGLAVGIFFAVTAGGGKPSATPTPNGKKFTSPPAMTIDENKIYVATFDTSYGNIKMTMDPKLAPRSVNNFVFLAREKYYDGTKIGRVQNETGFAIVQAGTQSGGISGGVDYSYDGETPTPGTKYSRGVVAMANSGSPASNGSQFFFVVHDWASLPANYTAFAKVEDAESLTVLDRMILAKGTEIQGGQLGITPDPPIYILKVTIEEQARG